MSRDRRTFRDLGSRGAGRVDLRLSSARASALGAQPGYDERDRQEERRDARDPRRHAALCGGGRNRHRARSQPRRQRRVDVRRNAAWVRADGDGRAQQGGAMAIRPSPAPPSLDHSRDGARRDRDERPDRLGTRPHRPLHPVAEQPALRRVGASFRDVFAVVGRYLSGRWRRAADQLCRSFRRSSRR